MGNDVVFKSKAFGGFDKKEVMDYVNKILEEKAFLQEELADVNQKYAQANYQAHEMGKVYEEYMQSSEKITSLQATVDELTEKNTSLQAEVTELKNELQGELIEYRDMKLLAGKLSENTEGFGTV